jgi:multicomponent Na+:H+ antiporter subunit E
MYWAAILAIKLILVGAKADVVKIRTKIKSDFLKVALANSITLVPGSVTLDLKDNRLTVMMLRDKNAKDEDLENAGKLMTEKLEKRLLKAQK